MDEVERAVAAIESGGVVVMPFDTVYGLCGSAYREGPTYAIYRLKRRPETMPAALAADDVDALLESLPELAGRSEEIARALLPGPYTLIFPNPRRRFRWLTGLTPDTIGVRVPVLAGAAKEVLGRVRCVVQTSANRHGGPEAATLDAVPEEIRAAAQAVVDGGELPGTPSTVIDFTGPEPRVLREGAADSAEALGRLPG